MKTIKDMNEYIPIDCDFYDHFEYHAHKKSWIVIDGSRENTNFRKVTKIKTLVTRDGSEYAILLDQSELRLDYVTKMSPIVETTTELGHLLDLLEYNHWANKRIIDCITDQEITKSIVAQMSHIINAHDIWYNRVKKAKPNFSIWQDHTINKMPGLLANLYFKTVSLFDRLEPTDLIAYQNGSGDKYQSTLFEIIVHLANHGTYHRGQIIHSLQQLNLRTIGTDYIIYSRKKLL